MQLHHANWKIWFLGGGLGGALGLCILTIILTYNAATSVPLIAATVLGMIHGIFLVGFWTNRFQTEFRLAWRVTMSISAICTLCLALVLQNYSVNSMGAGSLFTLSFMQAMFAITFPLHYNSQKLDANG